MANEKENLMGESPTPEGGFRRSRKMAISFNAAVGVVLAAVIVGLVNYLSIRHYKRFDLTAADYYTLSDKTIELLKSIKEPVRCIVFFQPGHLAYDDVRNLLREYMEECSQITVEYVDPDRNLAKAKTLLETFKLAPSEFNVVIFARGEGEKMKSKYVTTSEIIDIDMRGGMFGGGTPEKKAFKGEQAFTAALLNIMEAKQPTLYFLTGHGEYDPESHDERLGYSLLQQHVRRENIRIEKLNLAITNAIPADCDVLVIAGPRVVIPAPQLQLIEQHLQNKGRALIMIDAKAESGLEPLLGHWGVTIDNNQAYAYVSLLGMTELQATAYGMDYSSHPIVQKLEGVNTTFPIARSLEVDSAAPPSPDRPRVTWLVKSHEACWGETDLLNISKPKFDENRDKKGPLTLAVAVESGNLPGTPVDIASTRLVVVGSAAFVANGAIDGANLDFFLNCANWLINQPERVLGISPKLPRQFRLNLTPEQARTIKWTVLYGMPGCVVVVGAIVWWRRRK